jgi:hypothetical protein
VQPLIEVLRAVGQERGKSPAQVALNWLICKGALPIPGAKNAKQVRGSGAGRGRGDGAKARRWGVLFSAEC